MHREDRYPNPPLAGSGATARPVAQLLIVEPDRLMRWSLKEFLAPWFLTSSTSEPQAALARLRRRVDVLLLSADLPKTDLTLLASTARRRNPRVRIIYLCADGVCQRGDVAAAECIEKPFSLADLADRLGVGALHT